MVLQTILMLVLEVKWDGRVHNGQTMTVMDVEIQTKTLMMIMTLYLITSTPVKKAHWAGFRLQRPMLKAMDVRTLIPMEMV